MPKKRSKGTNIQGGVQQCFYVRVVRKGSDETKLRTTEIKHRSTIWIATNVEMDMAGTWRKKKSQT